MDDLKQAIEEAKSESMEEFKSSKADLGENKATIEEKTEKIGGQTDHSKSDRYNLSAIFKFNLKMFYHASLQYVVTTIEQFPGGSDFTNIKCQWWPFCDLIILYYMFLHINSSYRTFKIIFLFLQFYSISFSSFRALRMKKDNSAK